MCKCNVIINKCLMNNIEVRFQKEVGLIQQNSRVYKVDCVFHYNYINMAFIRNQTYFHQKDESLRNTFKTLYWFSSAQMPHIQIV